MIGINEDDFIVLVHAVLIDPIRIENAQIATPATDTLLCNGAQATLKLEVVHTLADGFTVGGTW